MQTFKILSIVMGVFFGFICSRLARSRGKSTFLWFQLGFFFGILAFLSFHALLGWEQYKARREPAEPLPNPSIPSGTAIPLLAVKKNSTSLDGRNWYYLDQNHKQIGPVNFENLKELYRNVDTVKDTTYIWSEGMESWKIIKELSYLQMVLKS